MIAAKVWFFVIGNQFGILIIESGFTDHQLFPSDFPQFLTEAEACPLVSDREQAILSSIEEEMIAEKKEPENGLYRFPHHMAISRRSAKERTPT